jgi:hypothetical protein
MSKRLPVPDDLQHLIEKRDSENDRRKPSESKAKPPAVGDRRKKTDRRRKKKT